MDWLNSILIIDDDPDVRKMLCFNLEFKGYTIFAADTIKVARKILADRTVSLVITDIRLNPDQNPQDASGFEFASEISPQIPTIIMTAYPTKNLYQRILRQLPIIGIIEKGEGTQDLLSLIEHVFKDIIPQKINISLEFEFASNLSLESMATNLQYRTHIGPISQLELKELFCRLFRRESKIKLALLSPGGSNADVILVQPVYGDMEGALVVVKFGPIEYIEKEVNAYREYVEPFILPQSTVMIGLMAQTQRLAGFKLMFLGNTSQSLQNFEAYYHNPQYTPAEIEQTIKNLFTQTCAIWYKGKRRWKSSDGNFTQTMAVHLSLRLETGFSELVTVIQSLAKTNNQDLSILLDGENICFQNGTIKNILPNPLIVIAKHAFPAPRFASISHGDLNSQNLFVSESGKTWLIDFCKTGWGPALQDMAELECVTRINLLVSDNISARLAFETALLAPDNFSEQVSLPAQIAILPSFKRAVTAVQAIRQSASQVNEVDDMTEYYLTMLFYLLKMLSLKTVSHHNETHISRQYQALYAACLISERLKHRFIANYNVAIK